MGGGLSATSLAVFRENYMKKLFFTFVLLNSCFLFAQDNPKSFPENNIIFKNLRLNLQANLLQELQLQSTNTQQNLLINNTFSTGLEFVFDYNESFDFGFGAFLQFKSSIDSIYGELGILPVYAFFDFPIIDNSQFPILLSGQLGFAPLILNNGFEKINYGLYHAFGFTAVVSKFVQLKLLYAHNYGKVKLGDEEYFLRKGNLTLALYYKF
jgi:hypothetical protein